MTLLEQIDDLRTRMGTLTSELEQHPLRDHQEGHDAHAAVWPVDEALCELRNKIEAMG
jgi:hypothetical protein